MLSSSVFFILRALQETAPPPRDSLGVMLALGAGVTCEMALVRAQGWLCGCADSGGAAESALS
jgi:predicted naringenin-chalcone synthase